MKFLTIFFFLISIANAAEIYKIRKLKESELKNIKEFVKTDFVAIVAFGNYCPILRRHIPAINSMAKEYEGKVTFIMLNAIKNMSDKDLEEDYKNLDLAPQVYQDKNLETVKELGFTTLSEVALLKISTNEILYKGAINNQFTFDLLRQKPTENYLKDAIGSALKNEVVKTTKSKLYGCAISF